MVAYKALKGRFAVWHVTNTERVSLVLTIVLCVYRQANQLKGCALLVLFTCKSKEFRRQLCPEGLLHQHDCCCQIPALSELRMSWTTKSMRGPYPQALGTFYAQLTSMNSGFHPTGLWYVTVLKLSRTHVPVMQGSLKIKFHLILLDFWKRTWLK